MAAAPVSTVGGGCDLVFTTACYVRAIRQAVPSRSPAVNNVTEIVPLFPLQSALFPGGRLALQIFEPRYLDMIKRCMREERGFGVVLLRSGRDARVSGDEPAADVFEVGTYAEIIDFNALDNGLLGIVAEGRRRFAIHTTREQRDHLMMADVSWLPDEPAASLDERFKPLADVLGELLRHPLIAQLGLEVDLSDARQVGWRLAELLPLEAEIKQSLLQMSLPRERLAELDRLVARLRG